MIPRRLSGRTGVVAFAVWLTAVPAGAQDAALIERGGYLVAAGGCVSCHTDSKAGGEPFAGGAAIKTPFGSFYPPNITPDPQHGIGSWTDADFVRAMHRGVRPDGANYFPAFPYTSYTRITEPDLAAMKAWLFSRRPVAKPSRPHEIRFPFGWRFLQWGWKLLFFEGGRFEPDPSKSAEWNRGAYLATALAHCGECHTPRNRLGGLRTSKWLAGTGDGPEGALVPNITPDPETGLKWTVAEIAEYLKSGTTPAFDFAGSLMADVIKDNTGRMSDADRRAIAVYLKGIAPIRNRPVRAGDS